MENTNLCNQIHQLQLTIQNDKEVAMKSAALFEALKKELQKKEQVINDQNKTHKETVKQLSTGLSIARKSIEDMAEKIIRLEEEKSGLEIIIKNTTIEYNKTQQEIISSNNEVKRWSNMYTELENVISTLKTQITTSQQSYNCEINNLQNDIKSHKNIYNTIKNEYNTYISTITTLTNDMNSILLLKNPTTIHQLHYYRTEILSIIHSMKRFLTTKKQSESSYSIEIYHKIAIFIEEITLKMLNYNENYIEYAVNCSEETKRILDLEQTATTTQRDLNYADKTIEKLIQQYQAAGFLYTIDSRDLKIINKNGNKPELLDSEVLKLF